MQVLINGVEYVPKKETLEELHKKQLEFIKEHKLKVGDYITTRNKEGRFNLLRIESINPYYGWICAVNSEGCTAYNIPIEKIVCWYVK